MPGFSAFYLLVLFQYASIQNVLSVPYLATRNLTSSRLDTLPDVSSPLILYPLNITSLVEESGIKYHVPNTMTTLYFHLGFRCKDAGMRSTVNSARTYCEQQLQHEGDGPLPISEDPFREDLGYGAEIEVVSSRPDHRLTWGILKDAMDGLWEFLVVEGRYVECEFDICYGSLDLVGRGRIRDAPETSLARQSRRRTVNDSLGFMCT